MKRLYICAALLAVLANAKGQVISSDQAWSIDIKLIKPAGGSKPTGTLTPVDDHGFDYHLEIGNTADAANIKTVTLTYQYIFDNTSGVSDGIKISHLTPDGIWAQLNAPPPIDVDLGDNKIARTATQIWTIDPQPASESFDIALSGAAILKELTEQTVCTPKSVGIGSVPEPSTMGIAASIVCLGVGLWTRRKRERRVGAPAC